MMVNSATVRRWERLLATELGLSQFDSAAIALGWAHWRQIGGRDLLDEVRRFQQEGFATSETVGWMSHGLSVFIALLYGRRWGATPEESFQLTSYLSDPESELAVSEVWYDHLEAGVPPGLLLLILQAGCRTIADLKMWVDRWRAGMSVEPELRFLVALRPGGSSRPN